MPGDGYGNNKFIVSISSRSRNCERQRLTNF
jgi:hypothetical protein